LLKDADALPTKAAVEEAAPVEVRPLELSELYRLYARSVARWAYLLGGSQVDPEDVMQEVFLIAHKQLPKLDTREQLSVWLHRTTHNVVRNRRRKDRARLALHRLLKAGGFGQKTVPDAAEGVARRQTQARVYRILDQMREKYRTVLILFELEGMSGEEIARTLDVKVSTIWVWLHRARQDFLKRLAAAKASATTSSGDE
jgi:RNA polymerase sigma-70 factor, ECF subfamily